MAITLVGTPTLANTGSGTAATLVVNVPTGVTTGMLMVLHLGFGNGAGVSWTSSGWAAPSGWTDQVAGTNNCEIILYKVAGGSEPASYTFSSSNTTSYRATAEMFLYSGVDATTPFLNFGKASGTIATTTIPFASTTFTGASAFAVGLASLRNITASPTLTASSGFTVQASANNTTSAFFATFMEDNTTVYTSSPVAPGSATASAASTYCTAVMLLKPDTTVSSVNSGFFSFM